ncbi:DUF3272 family protein [Streptococcus equinus]|uniref:DUF3272 family protein n=1 Tax=Streptococcus equinus TaxID=1335 RepID=UPI0009425DD6|nr:DUF3272 family protein [Streptococcus equinus]
MTIRRFLLMALVCAFETYFFNECILDGDYFFAIFWGLLLLRDIQRVYTLDKLLQILTSTPKKKD